MRIKTIKNKLPIYTDRFKIQLLGTRDVEDYMKEIKKPYFTEYIDNNGIGRLSDFEIARRLRLLVQYYGTPANIKYEIRLTIKDLDNNLLGGITLNPNIDTKEIEIGYWVKPEYQNNGIASEALIRVVQFIDSVMKNFDKVVLIIQEKNIRSLKVAKKCGINPYDYVPGTNGRNVRCIKILRES